MEVDGALEGSCIADRAMVATRRTIDCLPPSGGNVRVGETVRLGSNAGPVYRVVAIDAAQCWVRHLDTRADFIAPVWRCYPAFAD